MCAGAVLFGLTRFCQVKLCRCGQDRRTALGLLYNDVQRWDGMLELKLCLNTPAAAARKPQERKEELISTI